METHSVSRTTLRFVNSTMKILELRPYALRISLLSSTPKAKARITRSSATRYTFTVTHPTYIPTTGSLCVSASLISALQTLCLIHLSFPTNTKTNTPSAPSHYTANNEYLRKFIQRNTARCPLLPGLKSKSNHSGMCIPSSPSQACYLTLSSSTTATTSTLSTKHTTDQEKYQYLRPVPHFTSPHSPVPTPEQPTGIMTTALPYVP